MLIYKEKSHFLTGIWLTMGTKLAPRRKTAFFTLCINSLQRHRCELTGLLNGMKTEQKTTLFESSPVRTDRTFERDDKIVRNNFA